jgi:small-conductance mechanosensitive channel
MAQSIAEVLRAAWQDFLTGLQFYLPHVLAMISLLVVGLLIAWLVSFVARHLLRWSRFDAMAEHFGAAEMLKRAGLPAASVVVASLLFWLVWAAFMLSGLGALGVSGIETLSANFVNFLPRLVVAVVILVVGLLAANFAWRTTLLAAVNANLPSARLLSGAVRWLIATLAVAMALEQIGVAKTIMLTALAIAFGGLMLGVAIAIGIGGGHVARRILERQFPETPRNEARPDHMPHL